MDGLSPSRAMPISPYNHKHFSGKYTPPDDDPFKHFDTSTSTSIHGGLSNSQTTSIARSISRPDAAAPFLANNLAAFHLNSTVLGSHVRHAPSSPPYRSYRRASAPKIAPPPPSRTSPDASPSVPFRPTELSQKILKASEDNGGRAHRSHHIYDRPGTTDRATVVNRPLAGALETAYRDLLTTSPDRPLSPARSCVSAQDDDDFSEPSCDGDRDDVSSLSSDGNTVRATRDSGSDFSDAECAATLFQFPPPSSRQSSGQSSGSSSCGLAKGLQTEAVPTSLEEAHYRCRYQQEQEHAKVGADVGPSAEAGNRGARTSRALPICSLDHVPPSLVSNLKADLKDSSDGWSLESPTSQQTAHPPPHSTMPRPKGPKGLKSTYSRKPVPQDPSARRFPPRTSSRQTSRSSNGPLPSSPRSPLSPLSACFPHPGRVSFDRGGEAQLQLRSESRCESHWSDSSDDEDGYAGGSGSRCRAGSASGNGNKPLWWRKMRSSLGVGGSARNSLTDDGCGVGNGNGNGIGNRKRNLGSGSCSGSGSGSEENNKEKGSSSATAAPPLGNGSESENGNGSSRRGSGVGENGRTRTTRGGSLGKSLGRIWAARTRAGTAGSVDNGMWRD